ncbi:MAG: glycosyltransferase family 4 protein [Bacteroidales bacterium]|nr:glycosyltransferase family 4 protein [Bacteroidales bacterium]
MNVLLVNTSETTGGAAIACGRILKALRSEGVDAHMMVCNSETRGEGVIPVGNWLNRRWCFLRERAAIWAAKGFSRDNLFYVDIANSGLDITRTRAFRKADIIHLHWINQGFISLNGLEKIVASGKPIVWTMHDMWPFTGVCHHADSCTRYNAECHDCPLLPKRGFKDFARDTFKRKAEILEKADITFVGCSKWLAGLCSKSRIAEGHRVVAIPNPIDTSAYAPMDKTEVRRKLGLPEDKKLILFCSVKTTDIRKGMKYFQDSCRMLQDSAPDEFEVLILGKDSETLGSMLALPSHPLGYVGGGTSLAEYYNAADVFVTPSLQENLPNTIMEALCCGIPCVGFNIGGIPEMIDHLSNGYVASYKSAEDLARGIKWVLNEADYPILSHNAREKVVRTYSETVVARQYISLFQ